jgi:hypothetical protein
LHTAADVRTIFGAIDMHDEAKRETLEEEFAQLEAAMREAGLTEMSVAALAEAVANDREPVELFNDVVDLEETTDADPVPDVAIEQLSSAIEQKEPSTRSAGAGFWGWVSALAWMGVAVGAPAGFIGLNGLQYQHPAVLTGIVAVAIGPALLILFAASAAREAKRVRTETIRLARLATEALAPVETVEGRARNLGQTVRAEIGALQTVVETALGRFAELEAAAARNAVVFDQAVSNAKDGAGVLSATLQSERVAFEDLTTELRNQSDVLGENVGRQIRLMREASRLVRQEYVAADETLQAHLATFTASAAVMAERTEAIDAAATATTMASQRLDNTIVKSLDALAQATTLTDTARQSAENATLAANATASAVRETTQRAVADARRVAHMIRTETQAMEDNAAATLAKLKDAAEEARRASEEAQAAADRHAAAIQRRLSNIAVNAAAVQKAAVVEPAPVVQAPVVQAPTMVQEPVAEKVYATAGGRSYAPHVSETVAETAQFSNSDFAQSWALQMNTRDVAPADRFHIVEKTPAEKAIAMLLQVGVRAGEVFAAPDLDFIASRARQGGAARRQAVTAAAPEPVARLQRLFATNVNARNEAMAFRAKPDLASGKSVLIAYLLVDAALG